MRKVISSVLSVAAAEIGVEEEPRGSNWSPRIAEYIRAAGYSGPVYWCACFTFWALEQALKGTNPVPRTGSCDLLLTWARKHEVLYRGQPQVGDLFLVMASEWDATHIGFVQEIDGSQMITIEGNSNSDGSRNGYAVVVRRRRASSNLRFVRWAELVPDEAAAARSWALHLGTGLLGDCWQGGDGATYYPVRALLNKLHGKETVLKHLAWSEDAQALTWAGSVMPVPVIRREEGTVWGQVRRLAVWSGLDVKVDAAGKRITLVRPAPAVIK